MKERKITQIQPSYRNCVYVNWLIKSIIIFFQKPTFLLWLPVYQLLADPLLFSLTQWQEHFRLKVIVILLEQNIIGTRHP